MPEFSGRIASSPHSGFLKAGQLIISEVAKRALLLLPAMLLQQSWERSPQLQESRHSGQRQWLAHLEH